MIRNKKLQEIDLSLNSLVVFRKLMTQEVILPLRGLLDTETMDPVIQLRLYTEFISRLYTKSTNLTEYIFQLICEDENFYIAAKAHGETVDPLLEACVENELAILQRLARLRPHELQREVSYYGVLPEWKISDIEFYPAYMERIANIHKYGCGIFARHAMFVLRDGRCVPVQHPDPVRLSDLYGCDAQQQALVQNTLTLLNGQPAQNVLLYGDAGTGKSAAVKALVNTFYEEGLRMIELRKAQLPQLPELMEQIVGNPLKFIFFVDDLNLSADDPALGTLKSALEGCAAVRAENAAVYVTSNHRYLVRESAALSDTETRQELHSLAGRFGLQIAFPQPDADAFRALIAKLAEESGFSADEKMQQAAEHFAMQHGGYAPRAARQFLALYAESLCE